MKAKVIVLEDLSQDELLGIIGLNDEKLRLIEKHFNTEISVRDTNFLVTCDKETSKTIKSLLLTLLKILRNSGQLSKCDILSELESTKTSEDLSIYRTKIAKTSNGKPVYTKSRNQHNYCDKIKKYDLSFGLGPAGSGKTFLAVAMAVDAYQKKQVQKIVITRPIVEAGENLGFLPGDLKEKVDPYLRPIYDALNDLLGVEQTEKLIEKKVIEIAPLAYMRGRTLENAFIILDEAQNTTKEQMKMFLTRLGENSKMVVTGDESQVDLPRKVQSGLLHAVHALKNVEEISFTLFTTSDVVRHPIVKKIITNYARLDEVHPEGKYLALPTDFIDKVQ